MKKAGWIILILIILILVATIVFVFFYKDTYYFNKAVKESNHLICDKISKVNREAYCYGLIAITENEISICLNSDNRYIMSCFKQFASEKNDITICGTLVGGGVDEYNCYTAFAGEKLDVSICDSLQGEPKDYCIRSVAIQKNDASICNQLPNSSVYKDVCERDVREQNS